MGGWIVQVSNPASPKDTTRICRQQGRGNPPPTLIERRGNPPLVAKTRCDQVLLFSDCQKDGYNAQFAIQNKKGAPIPQYWDLQLQHRCALKRLKKVRTHYGSPQKEVLHARGPDFTPDLRFLFDTIIPNVSANCNTVFCYLASVCNLVCILCRIFRKSANSIKNIPPVWIK